MLLNKTEKARQALQAGPAAGLSLADRRILILVDGRRSLDQLAAMLGTAILPAIDRLLREGYIARADTGVDPGTRAAGLGGAVAGLIRATADVVQARAEQIRAVQIRADQIRADQIRAEQVSTDQIRAEQIRAATVAATPAAPNPGRHDAAPTSATPATPATPHALAGSPRPTGARRSLAACKMYLLDMLQLQRTPEAAELRAAIQCTTEPTLLVDALLQALRLIVATSNASYGERVTRRLLEILPLEALPRLEAMRAERNVAPPSLSIVA